MTRRRNWPPSCVVGLLILALTCNAINIRPDSPFSRHPLHVHNRIHQKHFAESKGMSLVEVKSGLQALAFEAAKHKAGQEPQCEGLVSEMCKPCPDGGPEEFCDNVKTQCAELFCSPMCRRNTWKCSIDFGSFSAEAGDPQFEGALCAQFIAQGCAKIMDCCADDRLLFDYVENYAYYDNYPEPRMPTPGCLKGPSGALCGQCNGAVKVKVEDADEPNKCPFPQPEGADVPDAEKDYNKAKDGEGKTYPGVNAHKGIQERCLKLEEKVKAKKSAMKSAFQDNVCKCMGCCEGECFFPVTFEFEPGGEDKDKKRYDVNPDAK